MTGVFELLGALTHSGPTIVGVSRAQVVDNMDTLGLGRVQISLPWQPDLEPWAPVAVLSAGSDRGTWFMPQVGDEVLVAFEQGDVLQPFVIGSLWNGSDSPPATAPNDAVGRRLVKTPVGHEIELDDNEQSITIKTSTDQTVVITPDKIELSAGSDASLVTLDTSGTITLKATVKLELKAPDISLTATTLTLSGDAAATLKAGGECKIEGALVRIG
jgi:uncharacterized protein involved in type VI secretion and phage assembly